MDPRATSLSAAPHPSPLPNGERGVAYTTHPDPLGALQETLALARRGPFYGARLAAARASSLADLHRLPVTTKQHLREAGPWGMIAVPREEIWHYHESTGTTGEPIACWYRQEEFGVQGEAVARWFPDFSPGKIVLDRFPSFAPISFCIESALLIRGGCHVACGNLSWDVPFPRALDFLQTLRPHIVGCLPLEMFLLRELALSLGIDPAREFDSLEMAILAGAPLPPAMRQMVERDWSLRVREIYGSNETLFLGASCERGSLHLETRLFIAEILDPETMEPVPAGSPGVLAITHLGPKAMPLVRYLTRDMIRVAACGCGRPEPAIELLGRQDEVVEHDGRRLYTSEILQAGYELADRLGSRVFFVVVRRSGLLFRVELERFRDGIGPELVAATRDRLGVPIEAEAVRRGDLLDPRALARTPKVYKPAQIGDWRGEGRRPLSIMEALLQWPTFDARTSVSVLGRLLRTNRRRRRLLREEGAAAGRRPRDVQTVRSTVYR